MSCASTSPPLFLYYVYEYIFIYLFMFHFDSFILTERLYYVTCGIYPQQISVNKLKLQIGKVKENQSSGSALVTNNNNNHIFRVFF